MVYAKVQGNKVVIVTPGMKYTLSMEKFVLQFGRVPRDDYEAVELIRDCCGDF